MVATKVAIRQFRGFKGLAHRQKFMVCAHVSHSTTDNVTSQVDRQEDDQVSHDACRRDRRGCGCCHVVG
jgi:hypothetical protein